MTTLTRTRKSLVLPAASLGLLLLPSCKPPAADLKEEYEKDLNTGVTVDHSLLDKVLKKHVDDKGGVSYAALHEDRKDLDTYVASLGRLDYHPLSRDEKLTLLINAYNACTLALILDHWPLASINDIPTGDRWKAERWEIGGLGKLSLDRIEHEYLRPKFKEPRIHFAVNCASIGCPPLRNEAYRAEDIEQQLQEQAIYMHNHDAWFDLDVEAGKLRLTKLYDWFAGDFEQVAGTTLEFAARFNDDLAAMLKAGKKPTVEYIEYDWGLNRSQG